MAFLKDITDKIVLGRWRFLNLKPLSGTTTPLVVDSQGNLGTGSGGATTVTSANITDATTVGKSVLTATDAAAARTAIGAGTSNLTIGTSGTQAAAGNHTHSAATTTAAGFMSTADKTKLDGIATGATAVSPATVAPLVAGTAAVGTSTLYARQDHVHPVQATVAALTTGRTFSLSGGATGTSAAFNGSANATIPVTLAVPTSTVRGGVLQAPAQADSTATDVAGLVTDLNAILAKLRTAGVIA